MKWSFGDLGEYGSDEDVKWKVRVGGSFRRGSFFFQPYGWNPGRDGCGACNRMVNEGECLGGSI